MNDTELVDRLASLARLGTIPRRELEWLVEHGRFEVHDAGTVIAPQGQRVRHLWIILSGRIAVRVDRGVGPRLVMTWRPGDVSGMLPYSRMKGPPGDNYMAERSEVIALHEDHFHEMVHRCPEFTAYTVHLMLDRARSFNASDLQDEKMISLGKLAAGLAHELNNPASATVRGAKLLTGGLTAVDQAAVAVGAAGLTADQLAAVAEVRDGCLGGGGDVLSPIERADREDAIADWIDAHGCDPALAGPLAEAAMTGEALDRISGSVPAHALDVVLEWVATGCSTRVLALDIERAATRIHELVAAVKRFTWMDRLSGPEPLEVEEGLRDTVRVVAAKARQRGVAVTVDVQDALPPVRAVGGELNQVWLNLLDNALDAVDEGGRVEVTARRELDRVVVRIVDDGPGIPEDVLPHVFDPFFTTKPPGQGTGLGLEITRRLVRTYHGDVSVDSRPGRTEFRVALPVDETGASDQRSASPPDRAER